MANGANTTLEKVACRFSKTLNLLALEPHDRLIYFVVAGMRYHERPGDDVDSSRYFYEEHSCPTNWISKTVMISVDGDTDPHGFLTFVRSVPMPTMPGDPNEDDALMIAAFPEVASK